MTISGVSYSSKKYDRNISFLKFITFLPRSLEHYVGALDGEPTKKEASPTPHLRFPVIGQSSCLPPPKEIEHG